MFVDQVRVTIRASYNLGLRLNMIIVYIDVSLNQKFISLLNKIPFPGVAFKY